MINNFVKILLFNFMKFFSNYFLYILYNNLGKILIRY